MKMNEIEPFAEMWMDLETVIQSEANQREKQISYFNAYMWTLEKWYRGTCWQSTNRDRHREGKYGQQGEE